MTRRLQGECRSTVALRLVYQMVAKLLSSIWLHTWTDTSKERELVGRCAAPGRAENFLVAGRVDTA